MSQYSVSIIMVTLNPYIDFAVQIDPMVLSAGLVKASANGMFARSTCTSLDPSG